jgi:hypothetical protein
MGQEVGCFVCAKGAVRAYIPHAFCGSATAEIDAIQLTSRGASADCSLHDLHEFPPTSLAPPSHLPRTPSHPLAPRSAVIRCGCTRDVCRVELERRRQHDEALVPQAADSGLGSPGQAAGPKAQRLDWSKLCQARACAPRHLERDERKVP